MIFKFSGKKDSGRGTEAAKRMITSYLNFRPNQGQKRPGQMDDLRPLIDNKKAKRDAGRKSGEKVMDKGKANQGDQSGAGGKTYNFSNATFNGNVTINN